MSEFNFATTNTPVPKKVAQTRDRIARRVGGPGCGYTTRSGPGGGARGWGYGPNLGHPFDQALATEIRAAWAAGGVGTT